MLNKQGGLLRLPPKQELCLLIRVKKVALPPKKVAEGGVKWTQMSYQQDWAPGAYVIREVAFHLVISDSFVLA